MEEKKKDAGFVIKDKRLVDESGKEPPQEETKSSISEEKPDSQRSSKTDEQKETDFPPINFINFILSLSTSALFHFGDFPETEGGVPQKNLPAAKQTIDILDMLSAKTKGNLDENENNLIQGILYELKMRYVKEKG